jgi:Flp pilus assembly pilin Flp
MATGDVKVTEGSGKNIATYTISEDAETKAIQRVAISDSSGSEVLTATQVTNLLGYLDGVEGKLDTLHTDVGTTLAGYLDGVEGKLDTLHTDLGTTLAGYLDGVETLLGAATPAGTNLIGRTSSSDETSTIYNGTTALTPKFAKITASSSGANTVVSGVASKKIRVLAWDAVANAAVNFKWQSATTPTDLTGLYYMAGQGNGVARSFNPVGYFETVAGEALSLNLSGAVAVGGCLTYVEV